jgi:glycosyltransferase involved in cell wall biosynthesis
MPFGKRSHQPAYDVCILHLADARYYPLFQRQAFALRDAGYKVALVSWEKTPGEGQPSWEGVDVYPVTIPVETFQGKRFFARYMLSLTRLLLGLRAELYQAVDPVTLLPARMAASWHRTRYNYFSLEYFQGADQLVGRPLTRFAWYLIEKAGVRRSRNTAVVCRSAGERLATLLPIGTPHVIRNVPPAADYEGVTIEHTLRTSHAIPDSARVAVFKGDIAAARGLAPFVRAMAPEERVHLVLLGEGPYRAELEELSAGLGLSDRVHYHGRAAPNQFPPLLKQADLGHVIHENVGSNLPLTLPSKLYDYMHAGLPIMTGNQGEMAATVRASNLGWVVDPDSQASVTEAVALFSRSSDAELREIGRRSRTAAQRFCWEQERVAYLDYVREALRRQGQPAARATPTGART